MCMCIETEKQWLERLKGDWNRLNGWNHLLVPNLELVTLNRPEGLSRHTGRKELMS